MLRVLYDPNKSIRDSYCVSTTSGHVLNNGNKKEAEAFVALRNLLLDREVQNRKLTGDLSQINMQITFGTRMAVYRDPTNPAVNGTIDLEAVEEPNIKAAIDDYFVSATGKAVYPYHYQVEANSKGRKIGGPALVKGPEQEKALHSLSSYDLNHAINRLLPQALANDPDPNPVRRSILTRRFLFVEYFQKKMLERVNVCLQMKTQARQAPGLAPNIINSLNTEIQGLLQLKNQLEQLDYYALCKVLLRYPIGTPSVDMIREEAKKLEAEVHADIRGKRGVISRAAAGFSKALESSLSKTEDAYAKDVVGMMYLDRQSYFNYCDEQDFSPKSESLADLFLREALEFSKNLPTESDGGYSKEAEYQAEGFQKSIFLKDIPEPLRSDIKTELRQLGITATYAIDFIEGTEYQDQLEEHPAGATDKQKKEIDARNAKKQKEAPERLKKDIETHRARVDYTATYEQNHRVQNVPALSTNVIDTSIEAELPVVGKRQIPIQVGLLTAGTAALAIASAATPSFVTGALASITPQPVLDLVNYAVSNPAYMLMGATALEKLGSWFFEVQRTGPKGVPQRTIQFKRLMLAAGVVGGAVGLTYYAPEALTQIVATATDYVRRTGLIPAGLTFNAITQTAAAGLTTVKSYFSMPINHAVKLGLGLLVANAAGTRAGALTRYGNYLGVGAIGALGALGVKMYQAVNDGVVDDSTMEFLGNQVAGVIEPVSNVAAQFFNYNWITQLASYWAVSKLFALSAEPAQEDQEESLQRRAEKPMAKRQADETQSMPVQAYMMGGVPLNQIVRAGKGVVKRVLPGKVVTAMNIPFDLATRFAENVGMVTKGSMATGLISGVYGLAWGLLSKLGSAYQAVREEGPPLSII